MPSNVEAGLALLDELKIGVEEEPESFGGIHYLDEQRLLAQLADKGFLRTYLSYCADTTDAPHVFHVGVGLGILGAAMGNNVRIPSYGGVNIYPNLWLVLIAPSGFMRKSTALYQGKGLLRHSVEKAILSDDFTPEKLVDVLENNPSGLLVVSEFTRLLDMLERDYNAGLRQMLTELYDSPDMWILERKKTKKRIIENAAISILGATTTDWLEETVKAKDLRGGFLARFLFLPATRRGPRVERPHVNVSLKESLKHHLWAVAEMEGEADYSEVWEDYSQWLYEYETRMESAGAVNDLAGVYSRTGTTTLKLALIFQASLRPQLEITSEAMGMAQAFIAFVHKTTREVTESFADGWFGRQLNKARRFIEQSGGEAMREELFRHMRIEKRKLNAIIETLCEQGLVEIGKGKSSGGRPPTVYRLKKE